jgi:hypothetical protein
LHRGIDASLAFCRIHGIVVYGYRIQDTG